MELNYVLIIFVCLVCAFIAAAIGERKGQRSVGFALGLFLGPIGVVIALLLTDSRGQICRLCNKSSPRNTSFCAHCGASFLDDVTVECPFCKREFKITS